MDKENIHIFLDMDGVLSDFVGGCEKEFDCDLSDIDNWGFWSKIGISKHEFWNRIQQNKRFWFDLEPYSWARDLVNFCMELTKGDVTIVTSPDMSAHTYGQKAGWVMKFFPGLARKLFVGPQKHLLAQEGRILIDDSNKNIDDFKKAGGHTILFPQKWNRVGWNFQEEDFNPLAYVEEQFDLITENIVQ